jgi:hypothetical protein
MNKYTILTILLLFISCTSRSQNTEGSVISLKRAFEKNDETLFLDNFPKNYNSFVSCFGWNDSLNKPYPLYKESTEYIDKFFNIISKNENRKFLSQIIDIGIDGKYQADGVSYFKMNIKKLFIKNPNLSCELLKNRSLKDIDSFWHFYLDSPQPLTTIPDNFNILKTNCEKVYFSLEKEVKLIQKENLVSEITDINKSNKLKKIEDFIPKGYLVIDSLSGYLNSDRFLDKIIILANALEYKNNESRLFLLLLNDKNGDYSLKLKNQNIIPCLKCTGGTGGEDSYSDLAFKNNILSFTQLKILDAKLTEIKYLFKNKESDFILHEVQITESDLNENSNLKKRIILSDNITLHDFNYNNYVQYLKYYVKINDSDGYSNIRGGKNSASTVIEKVKTGESVEVLDNSDDWWLIKTKSGNKGYIFKTKVKPE